ncbi:S-layer homology domain-containing protein [Candidatus Margulisiibacteriota bacterium]
MKRLLLCFLLLLFITSTSFTISPYGRIGLYVGAHGGEHEFDDPQLVTNYGIFMGGGLEFLMGKKSAIYLGLSTLPNQHSVSNVSFDFGFRTHFGDSRLGMFLDFNSPTYIYHVNADYEDLVMLSGFIIGALIDIDQPFFLMVGYRHEEGEDSELNEQYTNDGLLVGLRFQHKKYNEPRTDKPKKKTAKTYTDPLVALVDNDIMPRGHKNKYGPSENITRSEAVYTFRYAYNVPDPKYNLVEGEQFVDVPQRHGYYESVMVMYQQGKVNGYASKDDPSKRVFYPDRKLTRKDAMLMTARMEQIDITSPFVVRTKLPYKDVSPQDEYYRYYQALYMLEVLDPAEKLYPDKPITRKELAQMISRMPHVKTLLIDEYNLLIKEDK